METVFRIIEEVLDLNRGSLQLGDDLIPARGSSAQRGEVGARAGSLGVLVLPALVLEAVLDDDFLARLRHASSRARFRAQQRLSAAGSGENESV